MRGVLNLLHAILTFPVVVYTVLLGVVSLYWVSMLLGAVDLDLLGGAEHGGAADGAGHAGGDGAGHGAEGPGHHGGGDGGDADGGDADGGDADGDGNDTSTSGSLGLLSLRRVPVTVTISLLVIYGWLVSVLGVVLCERAALAVMSAAVFHGLVLAAALVASVVMGNLSARPLAPVFATRPAITRAGLVGKEGEVSTGRVDARFGQVLVKDGGAGLLLDARYEGEAPLARGDKVIVTGWDTEHNCAQVELIDRLTALRVDASSAGAGAASADAAPAKREATGPRRRSR